MKLDHVLGGCIVEMVRVVKVVNIVGSRYSTPQSQTRLWSSGVWELLSTSTVKSFKAEKNSTAQYSFRTSDRSGGTLCVLSLAGQPLQERGWPARLVPDIYSAGLSIYYIHRITSAKRTCEVRPSLLVREGNTLLVRYSLDTRARYSTYSLNFESQKGSIEALNFLIITS